MTTQPPGSSRWFSSALNGAQTFFDNNIKPWMKENYQVGVDVVTGMQDVAIKNPFSEAKQAKVGGYYVLFIIKVAFIGLDGAGKTTLIKMMKDGSVFPVSPTKNPST
jgi:ABC-type transport system involved in cytochrome bd biosynthesis fused ATPase/permease subunit